jgi:hypothetical protein
MSYVQRIMLLKLEEVITDIDYLISYDSGDKYTNFDTNQVKVLRIKIL